MKKRTDIRWNFPALETLFRRSAVLTALLVFCQIGGVQGQTYTWNGGTLGDWNTTTANWTGAGTTWVNSSTSEARFEGTGPLVTMTENITANRLTFDTPGSGSTVETNNGSILTLEGTDAGINVGTSLSLNVSLAGNVGFTKTGSGNVTLNVASTYTGATIIQEGELNTTINNPLPVNTDLQIGPSGRFRLASGRSQEVAELSGSGEVSGSSSGGTLRVNGAAGGVTFLGRLINALALVKTGTGSQTLGGSGTSNFSGGTSINAGTLIAAKNSAFGTGSVTVASGATWGLEGGINQSNAGTIAGTGASGSSGVIDNLSGANELSGPLTLSGNATIGSTAGSLTLSGSIDLGANTATFNPASGSAISVTNILSGSGFVVKDGEGTLTFTGANTYTGGTIVKSGTLAVDGGSVSHDGERMTVGDAFGDNGTLNIGSGGTVSNSIGYIGYQAGSVGAAAVIGGTWSNSDVLGVGYSGTGTLNIGNGGTVSNTAAYLGVEADGEGTATVSGGAWSNSDNLYAGFSGTGTLNIENGGTVSNGDGFLGFGAGGEGTATVNGGAWSNSGILYVGYSGTGALNIENGGMVSSFNVIVASSGDATGSLLLESGGVLRTGYIEEGSGSAGSTIDLDGGILRATANETSFLRNFETGDVTLRAGGAFIDSNDFDIGISAVLDGAGSLSKQGAGTLTLSGANTYSGGTAIQAGILSVGTDENLGSGNISFEGGSLLANATFSSNRVVNVGPGGGRIMAADGETLTLTRPTFNELGGAQSLNFGSAVNTGTVVITGNSQASGAASLDGGKLLVNGSLASSTFTVADGATLGGAGSLLGAVTVQDGGIFAPGTSPGTITMGALTLNDASVLDYELDTPGIAGSDVNDLTIVNGNLTLDGTLNITDLGGFGAGTYRLFNYGGVLTDNTLDFGIAPGGYGLTVNTSTANQVNLDVAAVTEQYWDGSNTMGDGTIDGGTGDWDSSTSNWTTEIGMPNGAWAGQGAVFAGTAGIVTIMDDVEFRLLRFTVDNYEVTNGAGVLIAVDNTAIIADPGVTANISANISGLADASVQIRGGGTVILSGFNNYGGGTLLSEGTLQIDSNDALGTGDFLVQNGTAIATSTAFDITNRTLLQGNITLDTELGATFSGEVNLGNASRTIDLVGSVNFAGTIVGGADSSLTLNSAADSLAYITGGLANSFGALRIGANVDALLSKDPGIIGISGDLRIDAGGELDVIYDGAVSPIAPGANVRLDGRLDFEGTAVLDVTFASLTGAGEFCNACNPSPLNLIIQRGNFSGQIYDRDEVDVGGALTLIKEGDGTLTLSGINTYSGPTLINGGTLIAASDTAISNTAVTVDGEDSVLRINEGVLLSNPLELDNDGALEAFGTYKGAVAINSNGGSVSVMKGGRIKGSINSAGDADVNLFVGGVIVGDVNFGQHSSVLNLTGSGDGQLGDALTGKLSGKYTLLKSGDSHWAIDRKLTPEGTFIAEGALVLVGKGELSGEIVNESVFVFAKRGQGDYAFDGEISGSGIVVHNSDSNTTVLGKQTYTGATYVDTGGLILGDGKVESSLTGDVIVNKDAFFGGSGSIGGNLIMAGTLSPGYSPGSLQVDGKFTLQATALLVIEIDSAKSYDRIFVGGKAKLGGTLRIVLGNGFTPENGQEFDILKAKSLSGTFSAIEGLNMWNVVYGPNSLSFVFGGEREPYQSYAETPNQYNAAVALEKLRTDDLGRNTDFDNNVRPILDALAPAELRQAFEAIVPNQSVAFSDTLFSRSKSWLPQMAARLADIRAGSRGFVASGFNQMGAADMKDVLAPVPENKWGVWVDGAGVFSQVAGFDGLRTGDASTAAGTVGVDYRLSDNFTAGFYTGYIGSWTDFGGNSEVDSNGTRFGLYSTYQNGGLYLNNLIGGEWNSYDWSRGINFPGLNRTANADTEGTVFETMFGGGYDWKVCEWATVGAFTSLEYTLLFVDGFTETGAGALNLRINDQDVDSLRTDVGLQFAGDIPVGQRRLRPSLRVAWRHEYLDGSRRINSALVGGAGPGFSTLLPGGGRKDSMLLNGGFSMDLTDHVLGYLYYTGDLAGGETDTIHSVNAGLRLAF